MGVRHDPVHRRSMAQDHARLWETFWSRRSTLYSETKIKGPHRYDSLSYACGVSLRVRAERCPLARREFTLWCGSPVSRDMGVRRFVFNDHSVEKAVSSCQCYPVRGASRFSTCASLPKPQHCHEG